jgi:hypothetical protein
MLPYNLIKVVKAATFVTFIAFLYTTCLASFDCLCGLVVRVSGYRSRGPGSIPGPDFLVVCLKRGPLSLVSTTEELFEKKMQ